MGQTVAPARATVLSVDSNPPTTGAIGAHIAANNGCEFAKTPAANIVAPVVATALTAEIAEPVLSPDFLFPFISGNSSPFGLSSPS